MLSIDIKAAIESSSFVSSHGNGVIFGSLALWLFGGRRRSPLSIDTRAALGSSSFASSLGNLVLFGSSAGGYPLLNIDMRAALWSSSFIYSFGDEVLSSSGQPVLLPLLEMENFSALPLEEPAC